MSHIIRTIIISVFVVTILPAALFAQQKESVATFPKDFDQQMKIQAAVTEAEKTADTESAKADADILKQILTKADKKNLLNHQFGDEGRTPLVIAAQRSWTAATALLLAMGADPSIQDYKSHTPLFYAFQSRNSVTSQLLVHATKDKNSVIPTLIQTITPKYYTDDSWVGGPLDAIARNHANQRYFEHQLHVLKKLLKEGYDASQGLLVICNVPFGAFDFIVSSDPLQISGDYSTQIQVINLLLEAGANPNITDSTGKTPLFCGHRGLLLKYGADPNHQDLDGNTPLMLDVNNNLDLSLMETLLKGGANPNIANKEGKTALFYYVNQDEKWNLLLKYGANPLHADNTGKTAEELHQQWLVEQQKKHKKAR